MEGGLGVAHLRSHEAAVTLAVKDNSDLFSRADGLPISIQ